MDEDHPGDVFPRPDPTRLTTEQYVRGQEIARRELISLREFLVSEMRAIERAHEEKFRGIETRFVEAKLALDAALKAASDAADKSERSFTTQIAALDIQTKTITSAQSKEVNDLKERFLSTEGASKGATDNTTKIMAAVIVVISILTLGFTITHGGTAPPTLISPAIVPVQPK